MAYVHGVEPLNRRIRDLAKQIGADAKKAVIVGYTARYAVFVHEGNAQHKPGKMNKYLERPARTRQKDIFRAIVRRINISQAATKIQFLRALIDGGLMLQRLSMQIVPIDTGALRLSAYTTVEDKLPEAIRKAFARSEKKRQDEMERRAKKKAKAKGRKK